MEKEFASRLTTYAAYLGIGLWLLAFTPLQWAMEITIMILPPLGIVIFLSSIYYKKLWTGLLALSFIAAFPLMFGLGHFFFGP